MGYVLVTGKDFSAAAESEPSITFSVMSTSSAAGKFLTSDDTQVFTDLFMVFRMKRYTKSIRDKAYLLPRREDPLM